MEEYRKRLRRICRESFWQGVRSVFCPSFDIPKIDLTYEGAKKSDADAMRKDWEAVGGYFQELLPPDPHDLRYDTVADSRRNMRKHHIRVGKNIRSVLDGFYSKCKKLGGSC